MGSHIINTKTYQITPSQFAVDGKIEEGKITYLVV